MIKLRKVLSYTLYFVLAVVLFTSCDNSKTLDNTNILIVKEIKKNNYTYNKTKYKVEGIYTKPTFTKQKGKVQADFGFWFYDIDDKFKVGDTIIFTTNNR